MINNISRVIERLSPYLSLIGIIFASVTVYQAKKQSRAFESQIKKMEGIESGMSTRHKGPFPAYSNDIVNIISDVKESIEIVCDVPGYGIFSTHSEWVKYKNKVWECIGDPNISVSIVTLDHNARNELYEMFFPNDNVEWQELVRKESFASKLKIFSQFYMGNKAVNEISFKEFMDAHKSEQDGLLKKEFKHAKQYEISSHKEMPVYYWIVDKSSAVFAFRVLEEKENDFEHGFVTTDSKIIESIRRIYDHIY